MVWGQNALIAVFARIDHNLIFDNDFNKLSFWSTHAFKSVVDNKQYDWIERNEFETRMQQSLEILRTAIDTMPVEWLEFNNEYNNFNAEQNRQRLENEANGSLWSKMA